MTLRIDFILSSLRIVLVPIYVKARQGSSLHGHRSLPVAQDDDPEIHGLLTHEGFTALDAEEDEEAWGPFILFRAMP